ncbi:hypothetical protein L1987_12813 [Smallanthus sonchifolius]|uniref:Uncharacterized protein n=1 Tax=Smallanthus sonchifolius TaxID=185202 RepID=A0ACB9JFQ5_9ASTR|nr:hypothetical protein L1987_12813 [Smallanthus sonchifolius]
MIREGLKRHYGNPVQYTLLMERAPSHPAILPQWPHQYRRDGNLRPIWMLPLPKGIHRVFHSIFYVLNEVHNRCICDKDSRGKSITYEMRTQEQIVYILHTYMEVSSILVLYFSTLNIYITCT